MNIYRLEKKKYVLLVRCEWTGHQVKSIREHRLIFYIASLIGTEIKELSINRNRPLSAVRLSECQTKKTRYRKIERSLKFSDRRKKPKLTRMSRSKAKRRLYERATFIIWQLTVYEKLHVFKTAIYL